MSPADFPNFKWVTGLLTVWGNRPGELASASHLDAARFPNRVRWTPKFMKSPNPPLPPRTWKCLAGPVGAVLGVAKWAASSLEGKVHARASLSGTQAGELPAGCLDSRSWVGGLGGDGGASCRKASLSKGLGWGKKTSAFSSLSTPPSSVMLTSAFPSSPPLFLKELKVPPLELMIPTARACF